MPDRLSPHACGDNVQYVWGHVHYMWGHVSIHVGTMSTRVDVSNLSHEGRVARDDTPTAIVDQQCVMGYYKCMLKPQLTHNSGRTVE